MWDIVDIQWVFVELNWTLLLICLSFFFPKLLTFYEPLPHLSLLYIACQAQCLTIFYRYEMQLPRQQQWFFLIPSHLFKREYLPHSVKYWHYVWDLMTVQWLWRSSRTRDENLKKALSKTRDLLEEVIFGSIMIKRKEGSKQLKLNILYCKTIPLNWKTHQLSTPTPNRAIPKKKKNHFIAPTEEKALELRITPPLHRILCYCWSRRTLHISYIKSCKTVIVLKVFILLEQMHKKIVI